jgi:hypothetical protein
MIRIAQQHSDETASWKRKFEESFAVCQVLWQGIEGVEKSLLEVSGALSVPITILPSSATSEDGMNGPPVNLPTATLRITALISSLAAILVAFKEDHKRLQSTVENLEKMSQSATASDAEKRRLEIVLKHKEEELAGSGKRIEAMEVQVVSAQRDMQEAQFALAQASNAARAREENLAAELESSKRTLVALQDEMERMKARLWFAEKEEEKEAVSRDEAKARPANQGARILSGSLFDSLGPDGTLRQTFGPASQSMFKSPRFEAPPVKNPAPWQQRDVPVESKASVADAQSSPEKKKPTEDDYKSKLASWLRTEMKKQKQAELDAKKEQDDAKRIAIANANAPMVQTVRRGPASLFADGHPNGGPDQHRGIGSLQGTRTGPSQDTMKNASLPMDNPSEQRIGTQLAQELDADSDIAFLRSIAQARTAGSASLAQSLARMPVVSSLPVASEDLYRSGPGQVPNSGPEDMRMPQGGLAQSRLSMVPRERASTIHGSIAADFVQQPTLRGSMAMSGQAGPANMWVMEGAPRTYHAAAQDVDANGWYGQAGGRVIATPSAWADSQPQSLQQSDLSNQQTMTQMRPLSVAPSAYGNGHQAAQTQLQQFLLNSAAGIAEEQPVQQWVSPQRTAIPGLPMHSQSVDQPTVQSRPGMSSLVNKRLSVVPPPPPASDNSFVDAFFDHASSVISSASVDGENRSFAASSSSDGKQGMGLLNRMSRFLHPGTAGATVQIVPSPQPRKKSVPRQ